MQSKMRILLFIRIKKNLESSIQSEKYKFKAQKILMLLQEVYSEPSQTSKIRSNRPEVFLGKGVLKMCSKITGEHPCQNVILLIPHFGMGVLF